MRAELRRSIFLACVGLLGGFALVVTLYGVSTLFKHGFGPSAIRSLTDPGAEMPRADGPDRETERGPAEAVPAMPGKSRTAVDQPAASDRAGNDRQATGPEASSQAQVPPQGRAPTFDIIRVEPTGETVIAGRAAPNTTVELLRDDRPIARALVDPSGQFAIVPPALPTGNSEITLRATGADGQGRSSRESVVVVVAPGRDTKPLIALTAPDKPTVVLSQPDPAQPGKAGTAVAAADPKTLDIGQARGPVPPGKARPGKTAIDKTAIDRTSPETAQSDATPGTGPVKIVSVEAEDGGKLYVTSRAPPGATVRLYLNDALVAPGSVGTDGRVAFTIGRGIRPGEYKVRVDQVDPVSGKVKTRSEVAFTVPDGAAKSAAAKAMAAKQLPPTKPIAAKPSAPQAVASLAPGDPVKSEALPTAHTTDPGLPSTAHAAAPAKGDSTASTRQLGDPAGANDARAVFVPEINTARIVRGDSLWVISRRIYGKGTRYTVIFDANQPQIRNPDRIYPGQIFVLPTDGTAAVPGQEKRG